MRSVVLAALLLAACSSEEAPVASSAPEPAEARSLKIVTLGDSLAYGTGDESDGGIAGRLDDELARRGVEAEITNLGINGAQTADLIARLRQERVRSAVAAADAIVLSIGANDLFRSPAAREETLRAPLQVADRILVRIEQIVTDLHAINPRVEILILGGYNPVPAHPFASLINDYLRLWDTTLAERLQKNPNVSVVRIADLVDAQRLSRRDNFHPGGAAYEEASKRIASILLREVRG